MLISTEDNDKYKYKDKDISFICGVRLTAKKKKRAPPPYGKG